MRGPQGFPGVWHLPVYGGGPAKGVPTWSLTTSLCLPPTYTCNEVALDVSCPLIFLKSAQQEFHVFVIRGFLQLEYHPDSLTEFFCGLPPF